jgi:hypothetical protein
MASMPSIKGSVFGSVVEDVNKLLGGGALTQQEATRWLQPEDLALLDANILVSAWYDIRSYTRMNELLRDVEGTGSNEYLRQCGRKTARRLLEAGLYAQLEYLHRTELQSASTGEARFGGFGRDLRKLTTISASILNFSHWSAKIDPERSDRYRIEVTDAQHFPEVLCWRSDGFVNEMATQHGEPDLWGWERPSPEVVHFHMVRSL